MAEHHFTWLTQGEFHMLIQVDGAFRGMHVLNQNPGNNADLIRHSGAGNRVRFTYTEEGHRMYVEVGGSWMGLHVSGGDPGEDVKLIRYEGDGHLVRPVRNENGTWKLLIKVGEEWKGLHVHQQNPNDRASLVRHSGGGNDIVLSKATIVGKVIEEGYLLIDVGGEWKGLHVLNQNDANGAALVRGRGVGNRLRIAESPEGDVLEIKVGETSWKPMHVQGQSSADNADLCRYDGQGNPVRFEGVMGGTGYLLVQSPVGATEWKGVHVRSQDSGEAVQLIRHGGNGNGFLFLDTPRKIAPKTVAPSVEDVVAPAAPVEPDDLAVIEGIGPKIAELLVNGGIRTFAQLAAASVDEVRAILAAGGSRFSLADPTTWGQQAALAAAGQSEELAALQASLKGGKVV